MADAKAAVASKGALPKPEMRNLLKTSLKKGLLFSIVASGLCAWYWKVFHMDYRQRKTKEYYATYDPVKEFERMRDMGLFQWAKPKPGSNPIYPFHEMEIEIDEDNPETSSSSSSVTEEESKSRGRCIQYEDGSSDDN